mmetsp:Transcript_20057/g.50610  ORF Transcript_20057/g.50610 Transcript_20057/m.50610 type:complete len:256 (+) Transcript_20057:5114-5881(+)
MSHGVHWKLPSSSSSSSSDCFNSLLSNGSSLICDRIRRFSVKTAASRFLPSRLQCSFTFAIMPGFLLNAFETSFSFITGVVAMVACASLSWSTRCSSSTDASKCLRTWSPSCISNARMRRRSAISVRTRRCDISFRMPADAVSAVSPSVLNFAKVCVGCTPPFMSSSSSCASSGVCGEAKLLNCFTVPTGSCASRTFCSTRISWRDACRSAAVKVAFGLFTGSGSAAAIVASVLAAHCTTASRVTPPDFPTCSVM